MKDYLEYSAISSEEKRTVKWFLTLFYIIYFTYDIFYYYLIPTFILNKHVGPSSNHVYFVYAIILLLLPLVKFLKNFGKLYLVKYLYLFTYILTTTIADLFSYYSGKENYTNGNMVEVFLLLTSPLFINNKYFWAVSLGILLKYVLIGVLLSSSYVLIPVLLIFILSIMAFILLK